MWLPLGFANLSSAVEHASKLGFEGVVLVTDRDKVIYERAVGPQTATPKHRMPARRCGAGLRLQNDRGDHRLAIGGGANSRSTRPRRTTLRAMNLAANTRRTFAFAIFCNTPVD